MQANRRDLCGQRFGKLTVIRRVEGTQSNRARADSWLCVGVIVVMNLLFLAQILSEDIPKAVAASN